MNILLRGGGFSNKGDEAMMLTVQREFTKRLPGVNFLLRTSWRALEEAHSRGLLAYAESGSIWRRASRLAFKWATDGDVRRARRLDLIAAETLANIGRIDGVVDFSGFNYSDEWGVRCARHGLVWADYCRTHGKPHVCLPQAWGPFRVPQIAEATRQLCRGSLLVYARDKVSLSFLKELLGPRTIRLAPDIAFLFEGGNQQTACAVLRSMGVEVGNSRLVAIAPNMRVYERCEGTGAGNTYVRLLTAIAEHCICAWGAAVVLVPHEFALSDPARRDDRFLCSLIRAGLSRPDSCFAPREYLSADVIKSIEGEVDFMIASRFHACVFALSAGVPAVALGWTHKYRELMELVGLDGNAIIHKDFDEHRVIQVLDQVWEHREQSAGRIRECLPQIRRDATSVFDAAAGIMRDRLRAE